MSRHTIPLGRIIGIPVALDYSWFLIFALLTWSFAVSYYPAEFSTWSTAMYWIVGAATAILLFVSVLIHELGHSIIAMNYKIPIRNITLFLFGGVAQIAKEPPSAAAEFWIAIAGPATSFALAGFFYLAEFVVAGVSPLLALTKYLAFINLMLVLFNLIPGFPLDGGRVFRALIWGITRSFRKATLIAVGVGRFIAFVFIFVGVWQMFSGNFGNGLWIAFIGWFLESAASAQGQQQRIEELLAGHKVNEAMTRTVTEVPQDLTLQQLVDQHILMGSQRCFFVKSGENFAGLLTVHHVKEIPRDRWGTTTVAEAMVPASGLKRITADAELWSGLEQMDREGVNQLPVMSDGHLEGVLKREDIISFLRTKEELGLQS